MKKTKLSALLASAGLALIVQSASATSTVSVTDADLVLGFRATGGTGATSNLEVDLGQASLFYNATPNSTFTLSGLTAADLIATYGSGWNTRSDLFFGVAGFTLPGDGTAPVKTLWASRPWSAPNLTDVSAHTTPWNRGTTFAQNTPGNKINSMNGSTGANPAVGTLNGSTATANSSTAAVIDASLADSWSKQEGAGNSFSYFNPTIDQTTDIPVGGFVGVDLFEMDPGTGPGKYLGYIAISSAGVATFTAVPEPSTYLLLGAGAVVLWVIRRNKAKAIMA